MYLDFGSKTAEVVINKHNHNLRRYIYPAEIWLNDYYYSGSYTEDCLECDYYKYEKIKAIKSIKLSKSSYTYNGIVQKPSVRLIDTGGKQIDSNNYTINYDTGIKK